jgi:ElaB/YqjD/DUF883 family membrane-anchored ribosome-binding protein
MASIERCSCIVFAVVLLALGGCTEEERHRPSPEALQAARPHPPEIDKLTPHRLAEEKDALVKKVKDGLDKLQKNMAELQVVAEAKGDQAKADFEKIKADIDKKLTTTNEELAKAKAAGPETWENMKAGVKACLRDANYTYTKAVARIEGKPAGVE